MLHQNQKYMIKREALGYLSVWANDTDRKPLVLRGARQVGKTTLVNEFATNYGIYLKVNLEKQADRNLFDEFDDVHQLTDAIFVYNRKQKKETSTLLFIDEIQYSPKAVAMLRYFYEEVPQLHVIAAGSLLESLIDKHISFPVGRVEYLAIHPCSFTEFLSGIGESFDQNLVQNLEVIGVHDRLMQHFRNYMIIGGMPAVIKKYAEKRDIMAVNKLYEGLINAYSDDVEKYAPNNTLVQIIRFIINEGWRYAGETIAFERFGGSNYRSREVGEAFRILEKTMLLELVYPTVSTQLPILAAKARKPKLIWLDTGIVNFVAGIRNELFTTPDIQDAWRGKVAEHIVAQEIIATETRVSTHRHYWVREKDQSSAEVDFIIEFRGKAIPIEVKSGINSHLRSLHQFMNRANHDIAVRVWSKPFSIDNVKTIEGKNFRLFNVPFYYVGVLEKLLEKYNTLS